AKEACLQCGGLCERMCTSDAIQYIGNAGVRLFQKIDMAKCTYPKCTACMDYCPQNSIDVTKNPPVILARCENEALCYGVCPHNAIGTTPTSLHIGEGTGALQSVPMMGGGMPGGGGPGGGMPGGGPGGPGGAGGLQVAAPGGAGGSMM